MITAFIKSGKQQITAWKNHIAQTSIRILHGAFRFFLNSIENSLILLGLVVLLSGTGTSQEIFSNSQSSEHPAYHVGMNTLNAPMVSLDINSIAAAFVNYEHNAKSLVTEYINANHQTATLPSSISYTES